MSFNVDQFKESLPGGGMRNNLFRVDLTFPAAVGGDTRAASFLIKNASIPGSGVSSLTIPARGGREIKLPGNRVSFDDYSLGIYNADFGLRNAFERWLAALNSHRGNVQTGDLDSLLADFTVTHLDRQGNEIANGVYTFTGAWPTSISPIDLDFGGGTAIEEFNVTMAYQYWTNSSTSE